MNVTKYAHQAVATLRVEPTAVVLEVCDDVVIESVVRRGTCLRMRVQLEGQHA